MKKYLLIILALAFSNISKTQNTFECSISPLIRENSPEIIFQNENNLVISQKSREHNFLISYDQGFHEYARIEVPYTRPFINSKEEINAKCLFKGVFRFNDSILLVYAMAPIIINSEEELKRVKETLTYEQYGVMIDPVSLKEDPRIRVLDYGDVIISPNEKCLMTSYSYNANNQQACLVAVYDSIINLNWEKSFRNNSDFYLFTDFAVSDLGDVAFFSHAQLTRDFKKDYEYGGQSVYSINWLKDNGNTFDYFLFVNKGHLFSTQMLFSPTNHPYFVGYYTSYEKHAPGYFMATPSDHNKAVYAYRKFTKELAKEGIPDRDTSGEGNKKTILKNLFWGLHLEHVCFSSNGNIVLIGQLSTPLSGGASGYKLNYLTKDSIKTSTNYVAKTYLLATCFDSLGLFKWHSWIFRAMPYSEAFPNTISSTECFSTEDDTYILLNDNPRNYGKSQNELKNGTFLCGLSDSTCMATLIQIDSEGKQKRFCLGDIHPEGKHCMFFFGHTIRDRNGLSVELAEYDEKRVVYFPLGKK